MDLVIANASSAQFSARAVSAAALGRVAGASLLGVTWTAAPACAVFAPLLLVAWWRARSRLEAGALGAAYQLGATHGLAAGASAYLSVSRAAGLGALILLAVVVGVPWALCWIGSAEPLHRRVLAFASWCALTLCPVGFGSALVAHPVMAAGWWFPGCGWWGLAAAAMLLFASFSGAGAVVVVLLSCVSLLAGWSDPQSALFPAVAGVATRSEPALGELDFVGQYRVAREALDAARASGAQIVALPEGSAGVWTAPMRSVWAPYVAAMRAAGRRVVVGASTRAADQGLDNSAVILGGAEEVVVPQRLPIPVAMWRPWSAGGFRAHPWSAGTADLGGRRAGFIVCWEGALVMPALLSVADGAEVLVHLANHAWVGRAGLPTVVATRAFGALFGIPVVIARNAQGGDDA